MKTESGFQNSSRVWQCVCNPSTGAGVRREAFEFLVSNKVCGILKDHTQGCPLASTCEHTDYLKVLFLLQRDQGNSYKGKHLIGGGLHIKGSVCYRHCGKHGRVQAGMVLEKELRVLRSQPKAAKGDCVPHGHSLSIYETSKPSPTVTCFLHKATPSLSGPHPLIVTLPMSH